MNSLKKILRVINIGEYILAAYQLFIVRRIDVGLLLTILSFLLTIILVVSEKKDIIIRKMKRRYNEIVLDEMAQSYSIKLSAFYVLLEAICLVIIIIYDKFYLERYDVGWGITAIFYIMWIFLPIIYVILTKVILSISKSKHYIIAVNSGIIFIPTIMIGIYTWIISSFWEAVLITFVISLPLLFCSKAIRKS